MVLPSISDIAKKIALPVKAWRGQCYAVACRIAQEGIVAGYAQYGLWTGPVHTKSIFAKRTIVRHGWIVSGNRIIDPTRFEFEQVKPYIYVGDNDYYDAAGQNFLGQWGRPIPTFNVNDAEITLPLSLTVKNYLLDLVGHPYFTLDTVFYLSNIPVAHLGAHAREFYSALDKTGNSAFVPIDSWRLIFREDV